MRALSMAALLAVLLTSCAPTATTVVTWPDGRKVTVEAPDKALVEATHDGEKITVDRKDTPSLVRTLIESMALGYANDAVEGSK